MVLASCERVPDAVAIAVLGGLASTGNAPISPAATLPAPIADQVPVDGTGRRHPGARPPDRGCGLRDAQEGHGEHQAGQAAELRPGD